MIKNYRAILIEVIIDVRNTKFYWLSPVFLGELNEYIIFFLKASEKYINVNYKNKYLSQFKRISTLNMKRETWAFK